MVHCDYYVVCAIYIYITNHIIMYNALLLLSWCHRLEARLLNMMLIYEISLLCKSQAYHSLVDFDFEGMNSLFMDVGRAFRTWILIGLKREWLHYACYFLLLVVDHSDGHACYKMTCSVCMLSGVNVCIMPVINDLSSLNARMSLCSLPSWLTDYTLVLTCTSLTSPILCYSTKHSNHFLWVMAMIMIYLPWGLLMVSVN